MTTVEDVADGLRQLMASELPGGRDLRIEGLRRVSEGLSRENWVFEGSWTEGTEAVRLPLILRRDPGGSLLDTDRKTEFDVLRSLAGSCLPVPRALWLDEDGRWLGRPSIVMVRAEGECDWFVLNGRRPLESRVALGRRFVDLLADVHRVDWRSLGLDRVLPDPGPAAGLAELASWEEQLRRTQLEPHPELELALAWLRRRAPESQATVLVHGDFKPGNALLTGEQVSAMLDWELAHLGDPLEDLGWVTNPYRAREHQIPGAWERDEIVEHYRARTGFAIERSDLTWWNVFSCFKSSVIILTGVSVFVQGHFDVIYQAPMALYRVMFGLMESAE